MCYNKRTNEKGHRSVANKKNLKKIETSYEELEARLREHRRKVWGRTIVCFVLLVLLIVGVELVYALSSFDGYGVKSSTERNSTGVAQYAAFQNYLLEYSNDGVFCMNERHEIVWNQSFEMLSPQIDMCGEYLVIYDAGGTELFILTGAGLQKNIETTSPIQTVCIAEQGTVAVLMKESMESQVKLFDKKGNELANGKFYSDKGSFPIDIALSSDAKKLAVNIVDISKGSVSTTISFYNFGSVGQSEIDNNVGSYSYDGLLIPEIRYVSDTRMIGVGNGKILIFEGEQKPELAKEIIVEEEILSCFHNENYIGIVYDDIENENSWKIKVMDMRGRIVMENAVTFAYDHIEFLENGEICATNENQCEIFTIHSIKKFYYTFDAELYKILAGNSRQNYTFIFKDTIEEVILQ